MSHTVVCFIVSRSTEFVPKPGCEDDKVKQCAKDHEDIEECDFEFSHNDLITLWLRIEKSRTCQKTHTSTLRL